MKRRLMTAATALILLLVPFGSLLAGEQGNTEAEPEVAVQAGSERHEAPMLADLVDAGLLPPLAERLPEHPKVLEVFDSIGVYGGTIHGAYRGPSDWNAQRKLAWADGLVRWAPHPSDGIVPALAESWEWSDDSTAITFHLRRGVKWSDGDEFTTEDIAFRWTEMENNPEIPEIGPFMLGGNAVEMTVIDDYTITFQFPQPYIVALETDRFQYANDILVPAHYLKQFDPNFNTEITGWDLFRQKTVEAPPAPNAGFYFDPDRPTLQAWKTVEYRPGQQLILERNPYYWKVDEEGNQLPYIDRIVHDEVQDSSVILLKIINGEVDAQSRSVSFSDFTVMKENEEKGGYNVALHGSTNSAVLFFINWDTPKENLRELFRNRDFRIALSVSLDREAMNQVFYEGTQEPRSYTYGSGSEYYDADLAKMYTEYDPDRARATFRDLGLRDTNGDGILEYPDGNDVTITIWGDVGRQADIDFAQFAADQWKRVGINVVINALQRNQLFTQTRSPVGPNHDMVVWAAGGNFPLQRGERWGAIDSPTNSAVSWWQDSANRWWNSNGAEGEQPDPGIATIQRNWWQAGQEVDAAKRESLMRENNRIFAENVYNIGTLTDTWPAIFNKNLRNTPLSGYMLGNEVRGLATLRPEQFYYVHGGND